MWDVITGIWAFIYRSWKNEKDKEKKGHLEATDERDTNRKESS